MNEIVTTSTTLDELTANIKLKLVENHVLENAFNRNINQNSVDIGQWLTQAKKLLKHGQWQNWLQENFQMTDRTAQRYMKIARYFGISGFVKTDNVVGFQPAALIELTKLPANEVQIFLDTQTANGIDFSKLSIRNLSKCIKQWKNPIQEVPSVTVDVQTEIQTAQPLEKILKLPAPTFKIVPTVLQEVADKTGIDIKIDFNRAIVHPDNGVLITRANFTTIQKLGDYSDCFIFATPLEFVRSDGAIKKLKCYIWLFAKTDNVVGFQHIDIQTFLQNFAKFGVVLYTQKKPANSGDNFQQN